LKNSIQLILQSLVLLYCCSAGAQTFSNSTGGIIPDNNTLTFYPVSVSGLPSSIDSVSFGLISVCLNINHTFDAQLDIYLRSPDGTLVKLVNNRGSNRRNFTNTCFREDAVLPIGNGIAPFTGNFVPEETINKVNNLQNPNGIWSLGIIDEVPAGGNTGTLLSYSISFGNNPPPTPPPYSCTTTNGKSCRCPDNTQHCELLPDMTNSEKIIQTQRSEFTGFIRIGVGTPNIGYGPLEMRGTPDCYCDSVKVDCATVLCPNGEGPKQKVIQRIYRKDSSIMTYTDRPAGFMQYHPSHGHIHLDDWTDNSLRIPSPDTDASTWPIIGKAKKISFCLVNFFTCNVVPGYCKDNNGNTIFYNDVGNPGLGTVSGCGTEQGIFPGYLDNYSQGYPGQEISFGNLCNGWYYIVSITDPTNVVKEMDETNNMAVVPVFLSLQADNCCKTSFYADTLEGPVPFSVKFTDNTMPLSSKWRWDFGDGTIDTTQFPTHIYTKPGVYDVSLKTVSKDTDCSDSVMKKKYIYVRKAATENNPYSIQVYPNPFSKAINIHYQFSKTESISITGFDILGRYLFSIPTQVKGLGLHNQFINMENLSKGTYFLRIDISGNKKTVKLIKQ
jgi:PKD repeat protein/subtilisin-like proprotein convertase family protein